MSYESQRESGAPVPIVETAAGTTSPDNSKSGSTAYVVAGIIVAVMLVFGLMMSGCVRLFSDVVAEELDSYDYYDEDEYWDEDWDQDWDEELDEGEDEGDNGKSMPWLIITTGKILTEGSLPYHHYFIAIAFMCFFSIFLTFMSLNADSEYRRKESELAVLRERSVLKSEERYRISSRDEVVRMLRERDSIEMVDQDNSQRM
jgi:hypothetical protein